MHVTTTGSTAIVSFYRLDIGAGGATITADNIDFERGGIVLLVLGGILYTSGMIFYGWRRLPYHHAVWHLFVLTGSVLHFFAVLFYVGS